MRRTAVPERYLTSDIAEATLILQEVGGRHLLPATGLQQTEWRVALDNEARALAASLTAYVLAQEGGQTVTAYAYYWQRVRPRWLPRWLWRRVPEQREVTTQSAQPMWTYPQANIQVPELGPVVLKLYDRTTFTEDDDAL
jgi:hypothetical protein